MMPSYHGLLPNVFLKPGDIYLVREPAVVSTVLGSCVGIVLFYPRLKFGGLCHAMLPGDDGREGFKYVDYAFRYMVERFGEMGAGGGEIQAKLFGGAAMFAEGEKPDKVSVGPKNVLIATELIRRAGMKFIASDTGGTVGRKIVFFPHTGEVFLKRLKNERCRCNH